MCRKKKEKENVHVTLWIHWGQFKQRAEIHYFLSIYSPWSYLILDILYMCKMLHIKPLNSFSVDFVDVQHHSNTTRCRRVSERTKQCMWMKLASRESMLTHIYIQSHKWIVNEATHCSSPLLSSQLSALVPGPRPVTLRFTPCTTTPVSSQHNFGYWGGEETVHHYPFGLFRAWQKGPEVKIHTAFCPAKIENGWSAAVKGECI